MLKLIVEQLNRISVAKKRSIEDYTVKRFHCIFFLAQNNKNAERKALLLNISKFSV